MKNKLPEDKPDMCCGLPQDHQYRTEDDKCCRCGKEAFSKLNKNKGGSRVLPNTKNKANVSDKDTVINPSTADVHLKDTKSVCKHKWVWNDKLMTNVCSKCNKEPPCPTCGKIPIKNTKPIEAIEEIDWRSVQTDGIQPEQINNNDMFFRKINEIIKTINLLIKQ